ncbi:MAG TPA: serine hydrolase domain-containing protein [Polyangiales bacterium]|nr:serine hydrolase domain-containing protein [Polyangiales bacterium]
MLTRRRFMLATGSAIAAASLGRHGAAAERMSGGTRAAVRDVMATQVAQGQIPGAVWLLARGDRVLADAVGVTTIGGSAPMRRDTIFRIASMTKAVTATAVMMLVDDGKLRLDAPAERWLPELANRRVLERIDGPLSATVPAQRPITVRDIMNFTLGFGALFDPSTPIQRAIAELQLVNSEPLPMTPHEPDEWMRRLGTLPLMHQPGARWMYNTGSLIQGVLVRRAADRDFDAFVRERIFEPLGMRDTGFFVPSHKLDRFAGCGYFTLPETGEKTRMDLDGADSAYARPPVFPGGAAGLVSTVDDYLSFARMLLNGGVHHRRRLLSARSVREMTSDQITPAQKAATAAAAPTPNPFADVWGMFATRSWGYGVSVITAPDTVSNVPGRYGWDGGFGTSWFNDPDRDLVGIVMTQSADFLFSDARESFWRAAYGNAI